MTQTPVITPVKAPEEAPIRRLYPSETCPDQKSRITRTVRRGM